MKAYLIIAMIAAGSAALAADKDVVEFLTTAADARMMDMNEGSLAEEKGTTEAIQAYGQTMVKDQRAMLTELRKIAALRGVTLPEEISEEKQEGRDELAKLSGEKFDKKFLKMIIKDHKRDLKQFRRAVNSSDEEVSEFAELYIPLIQSHLVRAKELKKA